MSANAVWDLFPTGSISVGQAHQPWDVGDLLLRVCLCVAVEKKKKPTRTLGDALSVEHYHTTTVF